MNLEQIDTSTTAGKAEVMRLAAEGRRVAHLTLTEPTDGFVPVAKPDWNWPDVDFAIISEPVGPEELWAVQFPAYISNFGDKGTAYAAAEKNNGTVVRYIRADLAGEGK